MITVLFLGNSLTYFGGIPEKFLAHSNAEGESVRILKKTDGGYELRQHLADLKSGGFDQLISEADIVVMQEFGTAGHDTDRAVAEIQKLFKSGTRFYFIITEFDIPERIEQLAEVVNITLIPSGFAHNLIWEDGYEYSQLHMHKDYHPNALYGYIAALAVFSVIFGKSCIRTRFDFLDAATMAKVPGYSTEEKTRAVFKIQEKVMEAVNTETKEWRN